MPSKDLREAAEPQKPLPLNTEMAEVGLEAGRKRRFAAEALFEAMDAGQFDLDLAWSIA